MTHNEKSVIRELAKKYMELATDDAQIKMNKRMLDTNDLKLVRPPVLMDEIPWYQMDIDGELTCVCETPAVREVESKLRTSIFRRKHFYADTLFEPFWRVTMAYDSTGIGVSWKEEIRRTDDTNNIVSHSYIDILEDEDSVELIKIPTFTLRPDKDEKAMDFYTDLFGDTMPVKLCGRGCMYNAPWDIIVRLRGIETVFYDLYDRPEHTHAIRKKFQDIALAEIDFVEKNLHVDSTFPELHCTPAYVSGLEGDGWKATWYRTMAQGFSEVSPDMHWEFDVAYALDVAKHFGYTYYGCCEPLDKKLDNIFKIPNLRKVGVSPWADEDIMAERLGGSYVYSKKPNPAYVAQLTDPDVIRAETEKTIKLCIKHGCPVEFVLKDISTVSNRPENLVVWSKVVSDVLDGYYGK